VPTAIWGSTAIAKAVVLCGDSADPNTAAPEFYRDRYRDVVARPLTQHLATFRDAVPSNDPRQIGPAAHILATDVARFDVTFDSQAWFGCYSPGVLVTLHHAAGLLASTFDMIAIAAAKSNDKNPSDITDFVTRVLPQEINYIQALNDYACQFGGQLVPQT
jgi:hypothetical protein